MTATASRKPAPKPVLVSAEPQRGALSEQELRSEPWGAEIFVVQDPDGNRIAFAG